MAHDDDVQDQCIKSQQQGDECLDMAAFAKSGRNCSDHARALVLYSKIPEVLLPRLPDHKALLENFTSLLSYHTAFPLGRNIDGTAVTTAKKVPTQWHLGA